MVNTPRLHDPCGGHLALDFVNSIGRGPQGVENERLSDYAALLQWCVEAGCLPEARARALRRASKQQPAAAEEVLERAKALREALFEVAFAVSHQRRPPRAAFESFSRELERALARARVGPKGQGFEWTWDWGKELDGPLWPIVRAAADLLVSDESQSIQECASDRCWWLFVDRSRNHRRRWCDMKGCGNLAKVRRHRRRQRESKSG